VKGFALSREDALRLLRDEYNPRCVPPWIDKDLEHKIDEALKQPGVNGHLLNNKKTQSSGQEQPKKLHTRCFKDVERRPVEWLWPKWIPLSKITMFDGDPELGKSTLTLDLAARVSTTGAMPDGCVGISGNVGRMSAEDAAEDTIKPRLIAAGANYERIHSLDHVTDVNGKDRPLEIPRDFDELKAVLAEKDIRLLIIDPLTAFVSGADANKDQEIRRVLFRLSRIAQTHRCAIVCMRHLNKQPSTKAIYRGNMSIAVIAHARSGLLAGLDPEDGTTRVLAVNKSNLTAKPKSLKFALEPFEDVCRIGWHGTSPCTADDLVQPQPSKEEKEERQHALSKLNNCMEFLRELLLAAPKEIKDCKKECEAAGFGRRTVERAANRLKLKMVVDTTEGKNVYKWELP
jgi:hypothetical protein